MIFNMILKGLRTSPRFMIFFILNLSVGIMGLTTIELLKGSFDRQIQQNAKVLQGSDVSLGARRSIPDDVVKRIEENLPKGFVKTKNLSLFSMGSSDSNTSLINIRVLGEGFPFYGEVKTSLEGFKPQQLGPEEILIYPELKYQLQVDLGDSFRIGQSDFKVKGFITDDGQQSFQFGALAPRVYISPLGLEKAQLMSKGSTSWRSIHYKLSSNQNVNLDQLIEELKLAADDPSIRINSPKTSSEQVGRVLGYLNDFLGLVSLSGLLLAGLGLIFLLRGYLERRRKDTAIFRFLGMTKSQIVAILVGQVTVLGVLGSGVGAVLGYLALPLLQKSIQSSLGLEIPLFLDPKVFVFVLALGTLSTLLLLPLLIGPYVSPNQQLLLGIEAPEGRASSFFLAGAPLVLFYWASAVYLSNSFFVGSFFVGAIAVLVGLAVMIGIPGLPSLGKFLEKIPLGISSRMAVRYLTRHRLSTLFVFIGLSLSALLMTLIPQIRETLLEEVTAPDLASSPTLFLFDIQPEQVDQLKEFFSGRDLEILNLSPMVQARLLSLNGKAFGPESDGGNLTREQEREERMRNRGVNLSYRPGLIKSEKLVEGRLPLKGFPKEDLAEITLEKRYSGRIGAGIGDKIEFDILGMNIPAVVVGIRAVRWTAFMPNFFISFGEGVLEDAPKTYLAAVGGKSLKAKELAKLQGEFSKAFANVSVVDVRRILEKISIVIDSMSQVLITMATLSLIVGLLVIYSLLTFTLSQRQKEFSLLKVLGAERKLLLKSLISEVLWIAGAAVTFGGISAFAINFVLANELFLLVPSFDFGKAFIVGLGILIAAVIVCLLAVNRATGRKPNEVFSDAS